LKTDNSYFAEKVSLRIDALPNKKQIIVLDCFAGAGLLWNEIKKTHKNIQVVPIEKESQKNKLALIGNNLKYLSSLDLSKFDIIDLDSYGIPFKQLEILFERKYKGIIIITAIQSGMGKLPNALLKKLGYTEKMIKKIPTLFNKNCVDKLKNYLYLCGIKKVEGYFINRKNYFYFKTN